MSTQLTFERPGRVQIEVKKSDGNRMYVSILQLTGHGDALRCKHLAHMFCVSPAACELVERGGRWTLDVGDVSFDFEPAEGRQLQEVFGLSVRHIGVRAAS